MREEELARLVDVLEERRVQCAAVVGVARGRLHTEAEQCERPRDQHLRRRS